MSTCQTTGRVSGGEKSLFQMHRSVWELVKIACARGIPQQSPENSQHETLIASVCLELFWKRGITIYPGCFPNITALLMVLWSLTSVWWLFQRNLPAANLCTCIIASVKLICLFASLWQRLVRGCPTDCLLLCFWSVKWEIYSCLLTRQRWSSLEHL